MKNEKLGIYQNIESVDMLDDGSMNVLLKSGKEAIIEIVEFNKKFTAKIYKWFGPHFEDASKPKEDMFAKLTKHDGYQECAKEALGWIDENPVSFTEVEVKEPK